MLKILIVSISLFISITANASDEIIDHFSEKDRDYPEISRPEEFLNNFKDPYYIVVFEIELSKNLDGFEELSKEMVATAKKAEGFLDVSSINENNKLVVLSSWKSEDSIKKWYNNAAHMRAEKLGESKFFKSLRIRVAKIERDYSHFLVEK